MDKTEWNKKVVDLAAKMDDFNQRTNKGLKDLIKECENLTTHDDLTKDELRGIIKSICYFEILAELVRDED